MREILFRGRRIDNGEWVEGFYFQRWTGTKYKHFIIDGLIEHEIDESTLGQYTGLTDKNGKRIFEGDVILWGDKSARNAGTAVKVAVEFRSGCFGVNDGERFYEFYNYCADRWDDSEITDDMWGEMPIEKYFRACFEVIGTIHDKEVSP